MIYFKLFFILLFVNPVFAAEEVNKTFFGGLAIQGYDAVAYFTDNEPKKGTKKYKLKHKEATWYFSSEKNLELFRANPNQYEPQYGGYCAYAMSKGDKVGISPLAYTIKNGKLYLNYDKDVQKKWEADITSYIDKADEFWLK